MLNPEKFKRALQSIDALGVTPAVLVKVAELAKDTNTDLATLSYLLRNDGPLVADIIRISSSPYYAPGKLHSNLTSAVTRIGLKEVIRVVHLSLSRQIFARDLSSYGVTAYDYWNDSIAPALVMEGLAKRSCLNPKDAYTIGILHGIGRVLINRVIEELGFTIYWDGQQPIENWERSAVGFDSAEAGAMLLEHRLFPSARHPTMNILIVDDVAANRKLLRAQLEAEGFMVVEAADGVEALQGLAREPLDAVISGILMPLMDGHRLCHEVRKTPALQQLRFILHSSTYTAPDDVRLSATVGADQFIAKPAPIATILAALQGSPTVARPRSSVLADEAIVLRQYSTVLVAKLEKKNTELQQALEVSCRAHGRIQELNADLERRVGERTAELVRANAELTSALAEVKQLNGLLPICSYCKSIRDGKDYWDSVESYITRHTNSNFSHGICPTCYEKHVRPMLKEWASSPLPRQALAIHERPALNPPAPGAGDRRRAPRISMNVLIVDDRPINLKLLRAVLEAEGATVTEAADGVEALGVLQRMGVDVIISDIRMPRMDGYRLCMEVRANPQSSHVPFIAYSAIHTSAGDERLMMEMGADRFVRKPISAAELVSTVRDVVRADRRRPPSPARTRSEAELLKEQCGQWQTLVATAVNALLVVQDDKLVLANPAAVRLLGATTEEELLGCEAGRFLQREGFASMVARVRLERLSRGSARPRHEQGLQRRDGSIIEVEVSSAPFEFRGRPALLLEACDVSERRRARSRCELQQTVTMTLAGEAEFLKINQEVLAILGGGLDGDLGEWWTVDRSAKVLRCIDTWHRPATEYGPFAVASRGLVLTRGQEPPGRVWVSTHIEWCEDIARDADGPRHDQASRMGLRGWIGFPIKVRQEVVGVVGFFGRKLKRPEVELCAVLDTVGLQIGLHLERQSLAEQFRLAQKMGTLGTLAAGVAHDINNVLTGIYCYGDMARTDVKGNLPLTEHLDGLMAAARSATALVRRILTFSQPHKEERRPIDLRCVVSEALHLLRAAVPASIKFHTVLANDAPAVLADATQVCQILMNLGTNAAQAMPKQRGSLTVSLENSLVDAPLAAAHPDLHCGRYARLTVSDNGQGMDVETLERIFEPFFTTKPPGENTGLGLSVVHGIVKSHGGAIVVASRRGEGTNFQVYFPAHLVDPDQAMEPGSNARSGAATGFSPQTTECSSASAT